MVRTCTFTAEGPGSIPGWGTRIPPAARYGQKKKKKILFINKAVNHLKYELEREEKEIEKEIEYELEEKM